ncbi:hypothetical protein [Helicobacter sp. 23-1045]
MSYAKTIGDSTTILTDAMIDCFNKDPAKGYLIFSIPNVYDYKSLELSMKIVSDYMFQNCRYQSNIMVNELEEWGNQSDRYIIYLYATGRMLRTIADKLREKANSFIELGNNL